MNFIHYWFIKFCSYMPKRTGTAFRQSKKEQERRSGAFRLETNPARMIYNNEQTGSLRSHHTTAEMYQRMQMNPRDELAHARRAVDRAGRSL